MEIMQNLGKGAGNAQKRIDDKQWLVIFYPAWDSEPEVYTYWNKGKDLALKHFNQFFDTKDDPDYPKMYKKIELRVVVDHLSYVVDEIKFTPTEKQ